MDNLHDATLLNICFEWQTGTVDITLETCDVEPKVIHIVAKNVTQLDMTRNFPWGESHSVNKVISEASAVTIKMQSGDSIIIEALSFELRD